ncbi:alpha/beta hydrolase [Pseudarthrobacter oxydans]|uniref:alpha/beta fold hydrolase n=1 Tax=Pseudarthrobacter oxydans TaxID=1671 RepID=UPI003D274792
MTATTGVGQQFAIDVGFGVRINYFDTGGDGFPVVILHGLSGSAVEFFETAGALPEFRTILVDLRGHGRSTSRPGDLSREAFVADVVHVIESAVGGPVALVGQSMGGHTAMLVAAKRPDLVSKLVLLESSAGSSSAAENMQLAEFFRSWPVPFPTRAAAKEFLGNGPLQDAWVSDLEEREDGYWPRFSADVMVGTIKGLMRPRWEEWDAVAAPTLVVYGEEGMFSAEEKAEFVARGHNVRRVDIPRASHDAHLDATGAWITALKSFLNS